MNLNDRETATVLAALRLAQQEYVSFASFDHFSDHAPLTLQEIDELCERINCAGGDHIICHGNPFDGMTVLGTFDGGDIANDYATDYLPGTDWWVIALEDAREGKAG